MADQRTKNERWSALQQAKAVAQRRADAALTAQFPQLSLHVYANLRGVVLTARVDRLSPQGRLVTTEIARATWKPARVTERDVVEWGQRALSAWLAANPEEQLKADDSDVQ